MPGIGPGNFPPRPPIGKAVDKKSTPEKDRKLEINETVSDLPIRPNPVGSIIPIEITPCPDVISFQPAKIDLMRIWLVNNNLKVTVIKQENY